MENLRHINTTAGFSSPLDSIAESRNTLGSSFNIFGTFFFFLFNPYFNGNPIKDQWMCDSSVNSETAFHTPFIHLLLLQFLLPVIDKMPSALKTQTVLNYNWKPFSIV